MEDLQTRRRAPGWVRAYSDTALHGLAGKLDRTLRYEDASPRQEWLLDMTINELEYRARRDRRDGMRECTCKFCASPFPGAIELPF